MKGISSMIGVVLVLGFTLVIAALIFTFSERSLEEKISSISDSELESYCVLHVSLEMRNVCYYPDKTLGLTIQNNGDATLTDDSAIRLIQGDSTCLIPLFLPNGKKLLPFETRLFELDANGCGFIPTMGETISFVELDGESYSCGVKESFEIKEC